MKAKYAIAAILMSYGVISATCAVELDSANETAADVNAEILYRCQYQLGEFGIEAVNMCIASEHAAREALSEYPAETEDIVWRCMRALYDYGWGMIKTCSDNDIAAEAALRIYSPQHENIIDACRDKVGPTRHADVRKCVDGHLAEQGEVAD